jgi:hypothetical protein
MNWSAGVPTIVPTPKREGRHFGLLQAVALVMPGSVLYRSHVRGLIWP